MRFFYLCPFPFSLRGPGLTPTTAHSRPTTYLPSTSLPHDSPAAERPPAFPLQPAIPPDLARTGLRMRKLRAPPPPWQLQARVPLEPLARIALTHPHPPAQDFSSVPHSISVGRASRRSTTPARSTPAPGAKHETRVFPRPRQTRNTKHACFTAGRQTRNTKHKHMRGDNGRAPVCLDACSTIKRRCALRRPCSRVGE